MSKDTDRKRSGPLEKSKVDEARDLLVRLTEMLHKVPNIRSDPVVKVLISGLTQDKNNEFQTSALAVATLRNAGCLDIDKKAMVSDSTGNAPKGPKPGEKKPKADAKSTADGTTGGPKPKMRGYSRTTDILLEDAVYRGTHKTIDDHPVAAKLQELRADPMRKIDVKRIKAVFKTGTLPNGKTFKRLDYIPVRPTDGKPYDAEEDEVIMVKDLDDIDLIAQTSPQVLTDLYQYSLTEIFAWADKKYTAPDEPDKVWPSLKGTETLSMIKGNVYDQKELLKALGSEKFFKPAPSPTLWYPGWKPTVVTKKVSPEVAATI
jgi:hypothetical protein